MGPSAVPPVHLRASMRSVQQAWPASWRRLGVDRAGLLPSVQECPGLLSSFFKSERRGFHAAVPLTTGSIEDQRSGGLSLIPITGSSGNMSQGHHFSEPHLFICQAGQEQFLPHRKVEGSRQFLWAKCLAPCRPHNEPRPWVLCLASSSSVQKPKEPSWCQARSRHSLDS